MVAKPDSWTSGDAYEPYVGRWSRPLAATFLEWTGLSSGVKVLDVGCGTGAVSAALLDRGNVVVGIDPSPEYVGHAAKRMHDPKQATFKVGDAQKLPFADNAFDAAVSGLVLNFVPDPVKAAKEMRRVVRPGGLVAAYVWDYAGKMQLMRHFWDAAIEQDAATAKSLDEGAKFPLCKPAALMKLFREAGLQRIETGHVDQPTVFRDFDDYWTPFLSGQGPAPGYAMKLSETDRADLRERIRRRLPVQADGTIPLIARAWTIKGHAPRTAFNGPKRR